MLAPFLNIPVSMILAAGTVFHLTKALQGSSWVTRLNCVLQALMALGMLNMVWHNVNLPLLPQLLLFGTASFWFLLQAVSRREFALGCHGRAGRLSCLYHTAMLAAMVFMLALPHAAGPSERTTLPGHAGGHASHTGGVLTVDAPFAPPLSALWTQPATQVLAFLFAAAVLVWLLPVDRVMDRLAVRAPGTARTSMHLPIILERSFEAGSALTMSLMFAASSLQT
ncbi:DUF5134 domain-containing protein [Paenarthrobacter aurescens]|jgi:hypothetical protein|uniref:Uncharacterized protein n=1 Tax=Paenarthrobacter aurescens (strain TC1) TaxID=290340 RepID=A1RDM8_PAEAT|nr:DUF5134 domain-containing protein [Paenarthrobacter aurescens]ABM10769.1 hypothetical protein AAur_pTC20190 [Paenarthrobacter aurescens TC1]